MLRVKRGQDLGMRIVPAIWRRQHGLGRGLAKGAFLLILVKI